MRTLQLRIAICAMLVFYIPQIDSQALPACGQTCVNNMLALAPSLGCATVDAICLCKNGNFAYGIRDCANEACGATEAPVVIAYGIQYCAAATGAISTATSNSATSSGTSSSRSLDNSGVSTAASSSTLLGSSQSKPSASTTSITSSSSSTPSSSSSSSSTTKNSSNGLSTGGKAGIGIGAVIGIFIIALLIYIALLLRRNNRRDSNGQRSDSIPELGPGLVTELPVVEKPGELEGRNENKEKEGRTISELNG